MFVAGYGHFLRTAAGLQWDEAAIELSGDERAWAEVTSGRRQPIARLVAGFCLAEAAVARDIGPFASATADPDVAACFEAQAVDEARHARFFDRVAAEVVGVEGGSAKERLDAMRGLVEPAFAELFEERLARTAGSLAEAADGDPGRLAGAVALYHLLLEGIVFSAGQLALIELLEVDEPALPGVRRGVERVLADERWHIGFGVRLLEELGAPAGEVLDEAGACVACWGGAADPLIAERTLALHRRRLRAARLAPPAQAASLSSSRPPLTPLATRTS